MRRTPATLVARLAAPAVAVAVAVAMTAGCAVGPDYVRPALPASAHYGAAAAGATGNPGNPGDTATQTGAQRLVAGADIRADWWTLFESPALNALIDAALAANPGIDAARASLRAAQENVYAQQGFFFPTVQAGYSPSRTKISGNLGGNSPGIQGNGSVIETFAGTPASEGGTAPFTGPVIYNFHTAQLTVGFVPDVFGGNRRMVEALEAESEVERFQLEAARITLATNLVAAAIQDASLRRQIAITEELVEAHVSLVSLAERQFQAGYASRLDLSVQRNALAASRQLLPPLRRQYEQNRSLLRLLSGNAQDRDVPAFELESLHLPAELPLTLPSRLIEQRPDVRAAEAQLMAASAQVGVARAARLPQFSIDASWGGAASQFSQMFWRSGKFFDAALNITQPLFAGGMLKHRERAARAHLDQATAQYRQTVLTAYQNVADSLYAIHNDAQALAAAEAVSTTASETLDLTRRQHRSGYLDRLALIGAEQGWREARLSLVQAQASRLGDTAALFQALGGGWWQRDGEGMPSGQGAIAGR